MLAVSFEEADDGGSRGGTNLRLSKVMRRLSRPSLVVFSRDKEKKQLGAVFGENGDDDDDDEDSNGDNVDKESWNWNHDNPLRSRRRHRIFAGKRRNNGVSVRHSRHPQQRSPGEGMTSSWNQSAVDDKIFEMEESVSNPGGHGQWKSDAMMTLKGHELEEEIGGDGRVRFFHAGISPPGVERTHIRGFLERNGRRGKRKKRFVNDNEVLQKEDEATERREEEDEEPEVKFYYHSLPETNPGILKGRHNSGRKSFSVTTTSPILAFGETVDDDDDDEDSARQKRRKRKKEERTAREQESSLSLFVSRVGYQRKRPSRRKDSASSISSSGVCSKKELVVHFADIGWKDSIISPGSFEANYCDGSCSYPMASVSLIGFYNVRL